MKVKAETGVMLPQVKKPLGLPAARGAKEGSSRGGFMGAWHGHPADVSLPASGWRDNTLLLF